MKTLDKKPINKEVYKSSIDIVRKKYVINISKDTMTIFDFKHKDNKKTQVPIYPETIQKFIKNGQIENIKLQPREIEGLQLLLENNILKSTKQPEFKEPDVLKDVKQYWRYSTRPPKAPKEEIKIKKTRKTNTYTPLKDTPKLSEEQPAKEIKEPIEIETPDKEPQIKIELFNIPNGPQCVKIQNIPFNFIEFVNLIKLFHDCLRNLKTEEESTKYIIKNKKITFPNSSTCEINKPELKSFLNFYKKHKEIINQNLTPLLIEDLEEIDLNTNYYDLRY